MIYLGASFSPLNIWWTLLHAVKYSSISSFLNSCRAFHCMTVPYFNPFPMVGHSGCSPFFIISNTFAINILVVISWHKFTMTALQDIRKRYRHIEIYVPTQRFPSYFKPPGKAKWSTSKWIIYFQYKGRLPAIKIPDSASNREGSWNMKASLGFQDFIH